VLQLPEVLKRLKKAKRKQNEGKRERKKIKSSKVEERQG
jgi:hypothetical protein